MVFKKGNTPWNKGKKGLQIAWSKGTKGVVKANSGSFKKGNKTWSTGKKMTEEFKMKISQKLRGRYAPYNLGDRNGNWGGDKVGYSGLHSWVNKRLNKPNECSNCNKETTKLDLANISQQYKRDLNDWEYLCRSCHMNKDGRISNLSRSSD